MMVSKTLLLPLILLSSHPLPATPFYVPGMAPTDFHKGDPIEVKAVKMTSVHTQLPYEYYSLPFCLPKGGFEAIHYKSENLGEVLRGDRIVNTPYVVKVAEPTPCTLLCNSEESAVHWGVSESQMVVDRIQHEYFVHFGSDLAEGQQEGAEWQTQCSHL